MGFDLSLKRKIFSVLKKVLLPALRDEFAPKMIYGSDGGFDGSPENLRISNTAVFNNKQNISVGNNVFIWHYSILDGTEKIILNDGCSIGAWVGIFTHSSQIAQRLYGYHYGEFSEEEKRGFFTEPVEIGKFSGISHHSVIYPGAKIGKGCLILPHSLVGAGEVIPDYAIFGGNPGRILGDTRDHDRYFLNRDPRLREMYDEWAGGEP